MHAFSDIGVGIIAVFIYLAHQLLTERRFRRLVRALDELTDAATAMVEELATLPPEEPR